MTYWETKDLRDEFKAYEREHRQWPRSGSVSKPPRRRADSAEEYERWHVVRLRLPDGLLNRLKMYRVSE